MSGRLVGEVLDAADELRRRGLSERGFHALVAIAEKAHEGTRQGFVRWGHIQAGLYGASKRTAERAVHDCKRVGVLRVVRTGFNNAHGRMSAPLYEIQQLTDTDSQVAGSVGTDTDSQVAGSVGTDTDSQVAGSVGTDTDKTATDADTQVSYLTGTLTKDFRSPRPPAAVGQRVGLPNDEDPQQRVTAAPGPLRCARCDQPITERLDASGWCGRCQSPPANHCTGHQAFSRGCRLCGRAWREAAEHEQQLKDRRAAVTKARAAAIRECHRTTDAQGVARRCDEFGFRLGDDGAVLEPAVYCHPLREFIVRDQELTA